ncbi:MAG: N-6 DNA methylase, partial [Peptococcaceae bacterium]|nr:N-6 DNA methylase [Peptococcaceae bacterium]
MQLKKRDVFTTIRVEGAMFSPELLQRIALGSNVQGLKPEDYHISGTRKLNEAISEAWSKALTHWASFQSALDKLPSTDLATSVTRERWLLRLFSDLGYGRLVASRSIEIGGASYPVSHLWNNTPIHLVGARISLDNRTAGTAGAARMSPHSMVQTLLNRNNNMLWGFVSNGLKLRILRDNVSLTRQTYVEFDLESMMNGEVYSDFILLWLLCHQSRIEHAKPEQCWLEQWSKLASDQGTRALDQLRTGVEEAINALGTGFISHRANTILRDQLRSGGLDKQDYYRQLLRMVYRLLFLFVAEDRDLLFDPLSDVDSKQRYSQYYSAGRLRRLADKRKGSAHADLYQGLVLVMNKLNQGCGELGLPGLGSYLWSKEAVLSLIACQISNLDLLNAIRSLSQVTDGNVKRIVDYGNLGAEELGSIYESLLELHPEINLESQTFKLDTYSGNERKTTGSYYTPTSLINSLLDSALDPILDEATKKDDPEKSILNLKVCDPACGSGHFLIAAAHRMAKRLAYVRTGDEEPSPDATRTALRDVIGRSIY